MNRRTMIAGLAIGTTAVAGLLQKGLTPNPEADSPAGKLKPIPDMIMGSVSALTTVTEYASFTCPHCAFFHRQIMPELRNNYLEMGEARLIFREVYFDRPGLWASMVARSAGPDRYFAVADLLFEKQPEWTQGSPTEIGASLRKIGLQAGIPDELLDRTFQNETLAENLIQWSDANRSRDKITSTPTFFVNGELVTSREEGFLINAIERSL